MEEYFKYKKELSNGWTKDLVSETSFVISLAGIKLKQSDYLISGKFPVVDQGKTFIAGYSDNIDLLIQEEPPYIVFGDHTKEIKYINFKFIAGADGVKPIKTLHCFNPKLFYYFIQAIDLPDKGYARHFQFLANAEIPIPPLNEQNRIVEKLDELLSELEKGKEQLQTSLEQLQVYRQSILKHAFEGKLSEEWRRKQKRLKTPDELLAEIKAYRRQQYEKQLKEYKAGKTKVKPKEQIEISLPTKAELADKTELPKGWFYIFLKDISEVVERVNLKEKKATETFLYLDIGGINNDQNIIENHKKYKWKDAPSRAQQIVKLNDILFSTVRTYMKNIAMVEDEKFSNQVASSGFTVVRALEGIISSKFLFKYLLSDAFIQPLNELQTGSSYPAVRDSDVFNQIVPICSLNEQVYVTQELDKKYSIVQNLEDTLNQNLIQSESLRQTLLQKAFEGKLVEQDPYDEPASVLLERIKKEREELLKAENESRRNQKKPMKKISATKIFEIPLVNTIKNKFGNSKFTFDQLKSEINIDYDDLREELFSILDKEKVLIMEFDQKNESMNFKYIGK